MVSWWDERRVYRFPDLVQCSDTVNLEQLTGTRILCDWISFHGDLGYLSRASGQWVPVTSVGQKTFSKLLNVASTQERIKARLCDDMTKKFTFYHMNHASIEVLVHDIHVQLLVDRLKVCSVEWTLTSQFRVQNVALIRNRLIVLMHNQDLQSEKKICYVDL